MNISKSQSYQHASFWAGATLVGLAAVVYAKLIARAQGQYFDWFSRHPVVVTIATPFVFLLAAALVRKAAPDAKGSGIPQVLEAIAEGKSHPQSELPWRSSLVSIRTAAVKVVSSLAGILGGASIGREGPTVQISASIFAWIGRVTTKYAPGVGLPSYLTVGAAAGVAAAFNTPLAGITFAIEEVIDGAFGTFRRAMMLTVIVSGIVAQALLGNYLYFGRPAVSEPDIRVIYQSVLIGVVAGTLGGVFARLLAYPKVTRLPRHWALRAILCGIVCALIALATHGASSGSGYEPTEAALMGGTENGAILLFPVFKMVTTVLSYLSGMAGGIFSPSLSIGAGIGLSIAKLLSFTNFRACALMGMVGFFSGVVQAPFTAVIIVTEMTDRHIMILPFMIAAFLGQTLGRVLMPTPLYHFLAKRREEG
jgi:H+/Cl- antiporter ClcA